MNLALRRGASYSKLCKFAILAALEFMMSFTFLGYIHIEPISITVAYLPILVTGCFLGVWPSALMGMFFGLASMYKASAYYVMPSDQVFSPFMSGAPINSLMLSVGARMLFGLAVGALFALSRRSRHPRLLAGLIGLIGPKLHSVIVFTAMGLMFPELGYSALNSLKLDANDALLALMCMAAIEAAWYIENRADVKDFCAYLDRLHLREHHRGKLHWSWYLFLACVLCLTAASTVYFAQRMAYMLSVHGLTLSEAASSDLMHLQLQSLLATLALSFLLAVCLLIVYYYLSYREYLGQLDALTGVMSRRMFMRYLENNISSADENRPCRHCFLFVDVDYFKSINDTLGHPTGDAVLRQVAQALKDEFAELGGVGRMGGDEFAVLITNAISEDELRARLDAFMARAALILAAPVKVTCSIGACWFCPPQDVEAVYSSTDRLLYAAKRQGRARYVMGALNQSELSVLPDRRRGAGPAAREV